MNYSGYHVWSSRAKVLYSQWNIAMDSHDRRKQEEIAFSRQRERDRQLLEEKAYNEKYSNKKYYSVTLDVRRYIDWWLKKHCYGKIALDYCCGLGGNVIKMSQNGAFAYGIDISEEEIMTASRNAVDAGYEEQTKFMVMDAENLQFVDNFFDVIICSGVLHHLDLNRALPELVRVLKPSGQILCIEALGYNPIFMFYRKMTPHLRTKWEIDHIITHKELRFAERYFREISIQYFGLSTILAVPFRHTSIFRPILDKLEAIDTYLLKIPKLQLLAWQIAFVLSKPR